MKLLFVFFLLATIFSVAILADKTKTLKNISKGIPKRPKPSHSLMGGEPGIYVKFDGPVGNQDGGKGN